MTRNPSAQAIRTSPCAYRSLPCSSAANSAAGKTGTHPSPSTAQVAPETSASDASARCLSPARSALPAYRQKSSIESIRNRLLIFPLLSYVTQKLSGRNRPNRFTFLSLWGNISTLSPLGDHPYGKHGLIENVLSSPKYNSMRPARYNSQSCANSFSFSTLSSATCRDLRLVRERQRR